MRETSRPGKATVRKQRRKCQELGWAGEAVANGCEASREGGAKDEVSACTGEAVANGWRLPARGAKVLKHTDDGSEGTGVWIHCPSACMLYTVDSGHANYTSGRLLPKNIFNVDFGQFMK